MPVHVDLEETEAEKWLRESLERLLSRAWRRGDVSDATIVKVFWETVQDIADSAEMVQATLAELRGDDEDEEDEQEVTMHG